MCLHCQQTKIQCRRTLLTPKARHIKAYRCLPTLPTFFLYINIK
nr:MAG TPA: hypothetical protein [Caudoviricetes sp.]